MNSLGKDENIISKIQELGLPDSRNPSKGLGMNRIEERRLNRIQPPSDWCFEIFNPNFSDVGVVVKMEGRLLRI